MGELGVPITWTNERRKLSQLIPWPRNPRKIDRRQAERLQESLEQFGQVEITAIGPGNEVYNGHQRLKSWAQKFGDITIDVRVSSRPLTEKEREKLTVILHRGAVGEWDFDELAKWEIPELMEWGFEADELPEIPRVDNEPAEPQIDRAEELRAKWNVELGQLWQLGEHRLICGDCTDKAVVDRVMAGEKAVLMVTDPPYGIEHKNDAIPAAHKEHKGIANDGRNATDFIEKFIGSINWFDGTFYIFGAYIQIPEWFTGLQKWRKVNQILVWIKDNPVLSRLHFNLGFEIIYHGYSPGCVWSGGVDHSDVLKYRNVNSFGYIKDDGERNSRNNAQAHPHQKPLDMICDFVEWSSGKGDVVYEPFSGSGTTLIACERLGRKCRAVEISPAYVAVTLERYYQTTGKMPELIHQIKDI